MDAMLKIFWKFVLLFVVITGAMASNVQDLPPCCVPGSPCDPIRCPRRPCCKPCAPNCGLLPSSDMKP